MQLFLCALAVGIFGWLLSFSFIKFLFYPNTLSNIKGRPPQSPLVRIIQDFPLETILPQALNSKSFESLTPFIEAQLDVFFKERLVQKMPVISMFIGDKTISQLKEVFIDEINLLFPQITTQLTPLMKEQLLFNIQSKSSVSIEQYLLRATKKIRIACFCLGFCWGILIYYLIQAV